MSENIKQQNMSDEKESRIHKLQQLRENHINPYPNHYKPEDYSEEIKKTFSEDEEAELYVNVAGRIILLRSFGKACFATIRDKLGSIQIYARKDVLGEDQYKIFKLIDVADMIGIKGKVFKTHKGEITVLVEEFTLLAKAVNGLPEKYHGLTDVEIRYRQRYLDLINHPEVKHDFIRRSEIIAQIRRFLNDKSFIEVETPMMHTIPGGAAARPFVTHHNALDMDLFLRVAPELYLKRLIVGGFERVFELNRNFRNEGIDTKHNPEFTMVEIYQAYADFRDMMSLFKEMVNEISLKITGGSVIEYEGEKIDFSNWQEISYSDALKKYAEIDPEQIQTREDAVKAAEKKGIVEIDSFLGKWGILSLLFDSFVEPNLIQPTIVYDYPSEISPLSKYKADNHEFVERFEAFVFAREVANAFSELNDPFVQAERFKAQAAQKAAGDDEAMYMDEDYINALEYGMPPTGGMGIGIDRLVMFFLGTNSIRDTILFPTMRKVEH